MTKNIFYCSHINDIGGVESMFFYLAKKYQTKDIVIYYRNGDGKQIDRLQQYVKVKKYKGEKIKCEKAFFNYYLDIIDNVEANEYYSLVHADFIALGFAPFISHPKITKYIGVSKLACESFEKLAGVECELCYNPIQLDKPNRILHLVSATRLTREKGKHRIIKLIELLNKNNIKYEWTIFTDDKNAINDPHIKYEKPRLDIIDYINDADYLVQLSDNEGYCYSIVEALMCGTGVICTPCPVFEEIGLVNGKNCFYCDFDMEDVPIKEIYETKLDFSYTPKKDRWNELLAKGASQYQKDLKCIYTVKATDLYTKNNVLDTGLNKIPAEGEEWSVDYFRYQKLLDAGYVTLVHKQFDK